jgi:transposase
MEGYAGKQYVGIDLHRRRTVIVRTDAAGDRLGMVRIENDPVALAAEVAKAGPDAEVVLEATYGWYWAADVLSEQVGVENVHLAHPLGVKGFAYRRVKNDERDAADLADLLRMGRLPQAWIAPPDVRDLREGVRHRAKLVAIRSGLKSQVHAVLAKQGVAVAMSDVFAVGGTVFLDGLDLPGEFGARLDSLRRLIGMLDFEIDVAGRRVQARLRDDPRWRAVQALPGVGPVLATVFVAEIGDVTRFAGPHQLTCWAGLTPKHRESDTTVHRGRITKMGSRAVRWAAVEAVQRAQGGPVGALKARVGARRGRNVAKVAAARKLLTLVYYGLRDGHIRALDQTQTRARTRRAPRPGSRAAEPGQIGGHHGVAVTG